MFANYVGAVVLLAILLVSSRLYDHPVLLEAHDEPTLVFAGSLISPAAPE